MSRKIQHQHFAFGPSAPPVVEYPFPVDAATLEDPPEPILEFCGKPADLIQVGLQTDWARLQNSPAEILGRFFASLNVGAVVQCEGRWYITLDVPSPHWTLFLAVPRTERTSDLALPSFASFLGSLRGVRFGPKFFPSEGFCEPVIVQASDTTYDWIDTTGWEGSVDFYGTSTGRHFVLQPNGGVGRWDWDRIPPFSNAYRNFEHFSKSLVKSWSGKIDKAFY